ncbi:CLUMA_CG018538, isoform A [Clunio marinus]|uniref:CLUMA_CG018538, isoform A n=1 Tax=Clunio marinus TaxID=568069 RepID=A0A1J1IYM9_9DIPT|nr:CLUMA_CG018538, isoform A [Clunio marinus]
MKSRFSEWLTRSAGWLNKKVMSCTGLPDDDEKGKSLTNKHALISKTNNITCTMGYSQGMRAFSRISAGRMQDMPGNSETHPIQYIKIDNICIPMNVTHIEIRSRFHLFKQRGGCEER